MNVLLIDDDPQQRRDKIQAALKPIDPNINLKTLTENDKPCLDEALKENPDLIILDWFFPEGRPQGEDTLKQIRELGYKGFIVIYSLGSGQFSQYIKPGILADGYHLEVDGASYLTNILKNLFANESNQKKMLSSNERPLLTYYGAIERMEELGLLYHPASMLKNVKPDLIRKAREKVCLASTEWNLKDGKIISKGKMGDVIKMIDNLAGADIPVLILGETGTGKELVARLLHYHPENKMGTKKPQPGRHSFPEKDDNDLFMALNCGAYTSASTLSVELFGSLEGAFTEANNKPGIFEQVTLYDKKGAIIAGGTVFLDEIGNMPEYFQTSILRVLEEKAVRRMGFNEHLATRETKKIHGRIPVEYRLVTATNDNLGEKMVEGKFRVDLFYRISQIKILLPPLRSRSIEDFNLLFQYFFLLANTKHRIQRGRTPIILSHNSDKPDGLGWMLPPSRDVIEYLHNRYPWKGNARELNGVVEAMVAMFDSDHSTPLALEDLPDSMWSANY